MLIRQKVHIGQIFNFRAFFWAVDADWTVRNERLPSACILVVSWAYGQIYGSGRLAAELNQRLISEVEGKLEQNEKKSERKCHHFEKMKKS